MDYSYSPPKRNVRECKYQWFDAWDWLINAATAAAGMPDIVVEPGEIAIDTHVHTLFSHCSISQPRKLILQAQRIGLKAICIMDHDDVRGAQDAIRCAKYLKHMGTLCEDFVVIPGIEINSRLGHIGAMFVDRQIEPGLDPEETVRLIHDEGGLAIAVHPYHSTGIGDAVFDAPFDALETQSGSVFRKSIAGCNIAVVDDPRMEGVAILGSSDAHYFKAVGTCYTAIRASQSTPESICEAIRNGQTRAGITRPYLSIRRKLECLRKLS